MECDEFPSGLTLSQLGNDAAILGTPLAPSPTISLAVEGESFSVPEGNLAEINVTDGTGKIATVQYLFNISGIPIYMNLDPADKLNLFNAGVAKSLGGFGITVGTLACEELVVCAPYITPLVPKVIAPLLGGLLEGGFSNFVASLDPPDPNFKDVAVPTFPPFEPIQPEPGLPTSLISALNALLKNQQQQQGFGIALLLA